jgi:hypothetical protein
MTFQADSDPASYDDDFDYADRHAEWYSAQKLQKPEDYENPEFWDNTGGFIAADGDDDMMWLYEMIEPASACPECGVAYGPCALDDLGRPMIHSLPSTGRTQ